MLFLYNSYGGRSSRCLNVTLYSEFNLFSTTTVGSTVDQGPVETGLRLHPEGLPTSHLFPYLLPGSSPRFERPVVGFQSREG